MQVFCLKDEGAISPSVLDQSSSSSLLALPAELRNTIWSLLLIHDQEAYSFSQTHYAAANLRDYSPRTTHRFSPSILYTCKQINAEGTPILYGANTFNAHASLLASLPSLILFSRGSRKALCPPVTSRRVINLIKRFHFHVRLDTDPRFTRAQAEESFSGAEEVVVDVFQAMYGSCGFEVLALLEGVRGVERAVVGGSVGNGKYARWLEGSMMAPVGAEVRGFLEGGGVERAGWDTWANGNR
ncbi:hypothetical protein K431DRAFT_285894 [Polychaeton citri CBS 116435]|uniref:Uncharacterized protein n=1 Tax=Polychaeton citri CBS 116435 TaxID=1314669 RepID=A0A9P4UP41_9PEZI|nr:hypothetical protein K431DRAFT_285894 [Polychaeton citri CBS 116435]